MPPREDGDAPRAGLRRPRGTTLGGEVAPATALKPSARDAIVALAALGLTLGLLAGGHGAHRGLDPLGACLAAVATLPLIAHGRRPLGVFALRRRRAPRSTVSATRPARRSDRRSRSSTSPPTSARACGCVRRRRSSSACSPSTSRRRRPRSPASRRRQSCSGSWYGGPRGSWATRSASAAGAAPSRRSAPAGHSATRSASAAWPPPRSAPGSPATCTTRRRTPST